MEDAGLVEGVGNSSSGPSCKRLTWQGHDFVEATRQDTTWKKIKDFAVEKTGTLSFVAVTEAIKALVAKAMTN